MKNASNIIQQIKKTKNIYIYGAGDVAREVAYCLMSSIYNIKIDGFLVTNIASIEGKEILGCPIMQYDCIKNQEDTVVIIAVLEKYRDEISNTLHGIGINNQIILTFESDDWCELRGQYLFKKAKMSNDREYRWLEDVLSQKLTSDSTDILKVYVARSAVDKELVEDFADRDWEESIQVGASLSDKKICDIRDDEGDNISDKNKQYCELTALYWLWKNCKSDWVGLSHYRRRFLISNEEIKELLKSDIDVVFTTPVINEPNVKYMYEKNHCADDWQIMKNAVKNNCPEYEDSVCTMELSDNYIPYNMFIMKKSFLNSYCEWLFPILEYCEKEIGKKDDIYQNRYVGFLAERLMSVYFIHNVDKYNMVFAHKHFIETKVN